MIRGKDFTGKILRKLPDSLEEAVKQKINISRIREITKLSFGKIQVILAKLEGEGKIKSLNVGNNRFIWRASL